MKKKLALAIFLIVLFSGCVSKASYCPCEENNGVIVVKDKPVHWIKTFYNDTVEITPKEYGAELVFKSNASLNLHIKVEVLEGSPNLVLKVIGVNEEVKITEKEYSTTLTVPAGEVIVMGFKNENKVVPVKVHIEIWGEVLIKS